MVIDYPITWYSTMLQILKNLRIMNKQSPLLIALLFYGICLNAQNKDYDWSVGLHSSIMSYSAVLENKLSNPYEYSIGGYLSFSRYLNNNFDVSIEGSLVNLNYPVGGSTDGSQIKYESSTLYDASFTLKYKLDNGYILRENHVVSPFIKIGGGAAQVDASTNGLEYFLPVGLGLNVRLGKHTSLSLQSTMKYSSVVNRTYAHQSLGLLVHFGKASQKRLKAMRHRERTQRYARIKKYRSKQKLLRNKKAKERLAKLNEENGIDNSTLALENDSEEVDNDLLVMNEPTVNHNEMSDKIIEEETSVDNTKPEIPENRSLVDALEIDKTAKQITQPIIPQPPADSKTRQAVVDVVIGADGHRPPMNPDYKEMPIISKLADIEGDNFSDHPVAPKVELTEENKNFCENSEGLLTELGKSVTFESAKARLRSKTHRPLNQVVEVLNRCESYSYVIIAHSDGDGNLKYNQKLSAKRAASVKQYLMDKGIKANRLITAAYGESLPLVSDTSEENKEKNRRIEFKMNKKSEDVLGNR